MVKENKAGRLKIEWSGGTEDIRGRRRKEVVETK
jgi:hypothetical protein